MPRYICSTFPIAAYPRKGTITWTSSSRRRRKSLIAAYPRKGTITPRCSPGGWSAEYCSLSPQGDDNIGSGVFSMSAMHCSLSPQGDDNLLSMMLLLMLIYCSLSPQGGKKLRIKKRCGVFLLQNLTLCFPWAIPL